jgi:iron complex transport system ATP-binding protein
MELHELTLRIGERILVERLTLSARPGECWCVIGRNGAGKSTLLRALAGLHPFAAGTASLDGRPLHAWPPQQLATRRAYLPQGRDDAFGYRAIDVVLASRHPWQGSAYWESEQDLEIAGRALAEMDVAGLAQRDVRSLSGGERQRVAMAAALAQDAPLLLLDEPTSALDLSHQVDMMALLARLCGQAGKAVVMVSHDLNLAHGVASHALLLMGDGAWRAGPAAEMMQAALLSQCLGAAIDVSEHGGRRIFLPALHQEQAQHG